MKMPCLLVAALLLLPAALAEYPEQNTPWTPAKVAEAYAASPQDVAAALGNMDAGKRIDFITSLPSTLNAAQLKAFAPALKQFMPAVMDEAVLFGGTGPLGNYLLGKIAADTPETANIRLLLQGHFNAASPEEMGAVLRHATPFFERPGNFEGPGAVNYAKTLWTRQHPGQEPSFELDLQGRGATIAGTVISNNYADGEAVSVDIGNLKGVKVVALKDGGFSIVQGDKTLALGKRTPFTRPVAFTMEGDNGALASKGKALVSFSLGDMTAISADAIGDEDNALKGSTRITFTTATTTIRGVVDKETATIGTTARDGITTVTTGGFRTLAFDTPQGRVSVLAQGRAATIDTHPSAWRVTGGVKVVTDNGFTKTLTISADKDSPVTVERDTGAPPEWPTEGSVNKALVTEDGITLTNAVRVTARMAGPTVPAQAAQGASADKTPLEKDIKVDFPNAAGISTVWKAPLQWSMDVIGPTGIPESITVLTGSQLYAIKPRIKEKDPGNGDYDTRIDLVPQRGTLVRENLVAETPDLRVKIDQERAEKLAGLKRELDATLGAISAVDDTTADNVMAQVQREQRAVDDYRNALRASEREAKRVLMNPSAMTLGDLDRLASLARKQIATTPAGEAREQQRQKAAELSEAFILLSSEAQTRQTTADPDDTRVRTLRQFTLEKQDRVDEMARRHPDNLAKEAARLVAQERAWEKDNTAIPVDLKNIVVDDTPSFPLVFTTAKGTTTIENGRITATDPTGAARTTPLKQDLTVYERHDAGTTTLTFETSPGAILDLIGDKAQGATGKLSARTRKVLDEPLTLETVKIDHMKGTIDTESFSIQEFAGKVIWAELNEQLAALPTDDIRLTVPLLRQSITIPASQAQKMATAAALQANPHQAFVQASQAFGVDLKHTVTTLGASLQEQFIDLLPFDRETSALIASHATLAEQLGQTDPAKLLEVDRIRRSVTLPGVGDPAAPGSAEVRLLLDPSAMPASQPTPSQELLTRVTPEDARQLRDLAASIRTGLATVDAGAAGLAAANPLLALIANQWGDHYAQQQLPVKDLADALQKARKAADDIDALAQRLAASTGERLSAQDIRAMARSAAPYLQLYRDYTGIRLDAARAEKDGVNERKYREEYRTFNGIIKSLDAADAIFSERTTPPSTIALPPIPLPAPVELQRRAQAEIEKALASDSGTGSIDQLEETLTLLTPAVTGQQRTDLLELQDIVGKLSALQQQGPAAMKAQQDLYRLTGVVPGRPADNALLEQQLKTALKEQLRQKLIPAVQAAISPAGLARALQATLLQHEGKQMNLLQMIDEVYKIKERMAGGG